MLSFALTRWPGLMPPSFSAAYALAFCAGVFFPRRLAWWLPLVTLLITDLGLNLYYYFRFKINPLEVSQCFNYVAYAAIIWIGRRFRPQSAFSRLLGGGLLGAILFYLITNTAAWFFNPFHNPEYTKTLSGLIIALTRGTAGYPETWEFFRNTLLSGGLFTGLFVGAMRLSAGAESAREKEPREETEDEGAEPKEAEA